MADGAETAAADTAETAETVVSVKGFDANLRCRGFQFEVGGTYECGGAIVACDNGFHAIGGHPLEVFAYYPPALSRYASVTQSGALVRHEVDSKIASARIAIEAELRLPDLIDPRAFLGRGAQIKDARERARAVLAKGRGNG